MVFSLIGLLLSTSCNLTLHEFYVSITYLKQQDQHLEIRHRIFKDDLELVVGPFEWSDKQPLNDSLQSKIFQYLESKTQCVINDKALPTKLQAVSVEGEGATCTVECRRVLTLPAQMESFFFENRILLAELDAQINMTHYISSQGRRSENLDARLTKFVIY